MEGGRPAAGQESRAIQKTLRGGTLDGAGKVESQGGWEHAGHFQGGWGEAGQEQDQAKGVAMPKEGSDEVQEVWQTAKALADTQMFQLPQGVVAAAIAAPTTLQSGQMAARQSTIIPPVVGLSNGMCIEPQELNTPQPPTAREPATMPIQQATATTPPPHGAAEVLEPPLLYCSRKSGIKL